MLTLLILVPRHCSTIISDTEISLNYYSLTLIPLNYYLTVNLCMSYINSLFNISAKWF